MSDESDAEPEAPRGDAEPASVREGDGEGGRPERVYTEAELKAALDAQAWSLLHRYGVVCRRLLSRETNACPWRELIRVYRRLEGSGEIRGGRFVSGFAGEQYALPDAIGMLREVRRTPPADMLVAVSGADPLNIVGILTDRDIVVRAIAAGKNLNTPVEEIMTSPVIGSTFGSSRCSSRTM